MGDDGQFFVDPEGLGRSAEGFTDRAEQIDSASRLVRSLSDPTLINRAFGNDDSGQKPMAKFTESASALDRALAAFSQATKATGETVKSTAKRFGNTEDNAIDAGKSLQRNFSEGQGDAPAGDLRPGGGQAGPEHVRAQVAAVPRGGGAAGPEHVRAEIAGAVAGSGAGALEHTIDEPAHALAPVVSSGQDSGPAGDLRPDGDQPGPPHLRAREKGSEPV